MAELHFLHLVQSSIECNNIGVALFRDGLLDDALYSFSAAARLIHPCSEYSENLPLASKMASCEVQMIQAMQAKANSLGLKKSFPDDIFAWAEPQVIDPQQRIPVGQGYMLQSAVILYNLALVHHMMGSTCHLKRALFLFDKSFSVVHSMQRNSPSVNAPNTIYDHIAMASLNNAGHICHSFSQFSLSRLYLDNLERYVNSLPSTSDPQEKHDRHQSWRRFERPQRAERAFRAHLRT